MFTSAKEPQRKNAVSYGFLCFANECGSIDIGKFYEI